MQPPLIVRSELTTPNRWFVVTRYRIKSGVDVTTQKPTSYITALKKYDVTEQMTIILNNAARSRKPKRQ